MEGVDRFPMEGAVMSDIDWTQYSDTDLVQMQSEINEEQQRRYRIESSAEQIYSINLAHLEAIGATPDSEWVKPLGAYTGPHVPVVTPFGEVSLQAKDGTLEEAAKQIPMSYPKGYTVTKDGKRWKSMTHLNVWEPGTSESWVEEEVSPEHPIENPPENPPVVDNTLPEPPPGVDNTLPESPTEPPTQPEPPVEEAPVADPDWPFWEQGKTYAKFDQVTWPYANVGNGGMWWKSAVNSNRSEPGTDEKWEQPE